MSDYLPKATYFPLANGLYEVKPGLFRFPHDFGNGEVDKQVFQIDSEFQRFRTEKRASRQERLDKYYQALELEPEKVADINRFIIERLMREHPDFFQLSHKDNQTLLHCKLSNEILAFDSRWSLVPQLTTSHVSPPYVDALDALSCQLQEDLAITQIEDSDQIVALHLCLPNHWSAEEKIGQHFLAVHEAVPGMDSINAKATEILKAMLNKGPYVRFAWGIATDDRLNHHPEPPQGVEQTQWHGRAFNLEQPELFLRIERQTLHGFPEHKLVLFTIRSHFVAVSNLASDNQKIEAIESALQSMTSSSLQYKGLEKDFSDIKLWLENLLDN